uniref:Transcription factor 20 n=1 Tax=Molossus molossus TaxID=27622 RepID=A0A7J8G1Z2_MOLMO|nr:transcription factor 20 [Molossus molossus]
MSTFSVERNVPTARRQAPPWAATTKAAPSATITRVPLMQQCVKVVVSPRPHRHLSGLLTVTIPVGMKWCPVRWVCISLMAHDIECLW